MNIALWVVNSVEQKFGSLLLVLKPLVFVSTGGIGLLTRFGIDNKFGPTMSEAKWVNLCDQELRAGPSGRGT